MVHFNNILAKGFEGHHFITGLASHFRDLMVAKDKITIELLEIGDNAKKKYTTQSEKCDLRFLLQAIDIANDCDLKYKNSKNQRLLVELTLMQLASITFDGEKKNNKPFIVAAIHFKSKARKTRKLNSEIEQTNIESSESITLDNDLENIKKEPIKPVLENIKRRPSTLSLSSIDRKKEISIIDVNFEEVEGMPTDSFTENEAIHFWNSYIEKLLAQGKKSVASIMNACNPTVKDNCIHFSLPNSLISHQKLFQNRCFTTKPVAPPIQHQTVMKISKIGFDLCR